MGSHFGSSVEAQALYSDSPYLFDTRIAIMGAGASAGVAAATHAASVNELTKALQGLSVAEREKLTNALTPPAESKKPEAEEKKAVEQKADEKPKAPEEKNADEKKVDEKPKAAEE